MMYLLNVVYRDGMVYSEQMDFITVLSEMEERLENNEEHANVRVWSITPLEVGHE